MLDAMARPHLNRRGQPVCLGGFAVQRLLDVVLATAGDDGQHRRGRHRRRVAARIGGRRPHDVQGPGVVLRPEDEGGKPCIRVAPGDAEHARAVRGHPDLGPQPPIRRQVKHRGAQRKPFRVPVDEFTVGLPQRADRREGFLEATHRLGPIHSVGFLPSRSPVPMPSIARPRVSRCSVAAACAVTAGLRRAVSVTHAPSRRPMTPPPPRRIVSPASRHHPLVPRSGSVAHD